MSHFFIKLPWPPTSNTYWRRHGHTYFVSAKGIYYRNLVAIECFHWRNFFSNNQRLRVHILAYPPDKRKRDLDNICKSLLDSLQNAGVYEDDNQIDILYLERMPEHINEVHVSIYEITD